MTESIIKRYFSILYSKVGVFVLGLAITPLLVRLLGSSNYGDYAFLMSVFQILMIASGAGIFDGIRKFVAEDREDNFPNWQDSVFGFFVRIASVTSGFFVTVIIGVVLFELASGFFGDDLRQFLYFLAVLIIARQVLYIARSTLMGIGEERYGEPLTVIRQGIFGVFGLLLVYFGNGLMGAFVGQITATLLAGLIGIWILRDKINLKSVVRPTSDNFPKQELATYNLWNVGLILLLTSLYHIDVLILQPIAGSQQAGYYKAALVIAHFFWFVPLTLQRILLHTTSELWSKENIEEITKRSSRLVRFTLVFSLLLTSGLVALVEPFVKLYFGVEFLPAVEPILLLLPGVLGFSLARPIIGAVQGTGEIRVLIFLTGVAAGLNTVLNLVLIPRYGMNGAAVATSIGYGSVFILSYISARHVGFNPLDDVRIFPVIVTAVVASLGIFLLAEHINSGIVALLIVPPIGAFLYLVAVLKTRAISPEELISISESLPESSASLISTIVRKLK